MRRATDAVTRDESEVVVGEDQWGVPILECPQIKLDRREYGKEGQTGRFWYKCAECGNECLHEVNGKVYYHTLACSKSNGIGYGGERQVTTGIHHPLCDCLTCDERKGKRSKT
jgi:hypothetical protein